MSIFVNMILPLPLNFLKAGTKPRAKSLLIRSHEDGVPFPLRFGIGNWKVESYSKTVTQHY